MVGRRRTPTDTKPPDLTRRPGQADLNEIVAYNFRAARELRGWTQEDTARALEPLLGQRLPQASISAIERAYEGDRHREFDAHEILAFALAFDLPLVWFFLPPPPDHRNLHHTSNIVSELYGIVFGRETQLQPVYDRLRQLGIDEQTDVDRTIENLTGRPSPARQSSYRERRKRLLLALLDEYTDDVDRAAEEIGAFFDHLRQVGVRGLVAERLNDGDYVGLPPVPEDFGKTENLEKDRRRRPTTTRMTDPGPPDEINYDLEESLELLAALEDARDALAHSDHLAVVAQVEHEIARLSRKLGFDRPSGGRDGR